jgi:hypothetical protein
METSSPASRTGLSGLALYKAGRAGQARPRPPPPYYISVDRLGLPHDPERTDGAVMLAVPGAIKPRYRA